MKMSEEVDELSIDELLKGPFSFGGELQLSMIRPWRLNTKKIQNHQCSLDSTLNLKTLTLPIRRYGQMKLPDGSLTVHEVTWTMENVTITVRDLLIRIDAFYSSKIAKEHQLTEYEKKDDIFYPDGYNPKTYRNLIVRDGGGLCFFEGISVDAEGNGTVNLGS
jgi:hypothetical protein